MGWGSSVRLLLRDRATASWGWGKGVIAIAADCVTVELRIVAGGGGVGRSSYVRLLLRARATAPWDWEKGAPSPKLPWLFQLRCPRRFALVGPRKAVKTRPNGRNNLRGKLKGRYYSVKKP